MRDRSEASRANGDWKLSENTVNAAGQVQETLPSWVSECMPAPPEAPLGETTDSRRAGACFQRLADEGYRQQISLPAGRAASGRCSGARPGSSSRWPSLLTGFCFWRIRRDLS